MNEDKTIVFDPLGELLKVVEDINKVKKEGVDENDVRTQAD